MKKKEAKCAICRRALPGIETWNGEGRVHLCDNPECRAKLHESWHPFYVGDGERKCAWKRCENTVPAGYYRSRSTILTCSARCRDYVNRSGTRLVCAYEGCRRPFKGMSGTLFCSKDCTDAEFHARAVRRTGRWRELYLKYEEFIKEHYLGNGVKTARLATQVWYEFLDSTEITDVAQADATTVSAWIAWGQKVGRAVQRYMALLSTHMEWLIFNGYRKDNPVTRFHRPREPKRLPRPYSEEEMTYIWSLLDKRGTTLTRLAVALAEEAGPRIGEISRIKLSDLDLKGRRILIGLPNKTMTERWIRFHDKSAKFLELWLTERNPSVKHEYLLHQRNGRPFTNASLHYAIAKVVCKTVLHKKVNEDGLDEWSTHRLRHTMATRLIRYGADAATVMSLGGWSTGEAMARYGKVEDPVADRGYREAMARAAERKAQPQTKHSSFRKYVKHTPKRAA